MQAVKRFAVILTTLSLLGLSSVAIPTFAPPPIYSVLFTIENAQGNYLCPATVYVHWPGGSSWDYSCTWPPDGPGRVSISMPGYAVNFTYYASYNGVNSNPGRNTTINGILQITIVIRAPLGTPLG